MWIRCSLGIGYLKKLNIINIGMKVIVKRGLSEIVSALLLMVIALSVFSILYAFISSYFTERKSLLYLIYSVNLEKLWERVTIVYTLYNSSGLYICIYNYGYIDAEISLLFINGTLIDNNLVYPRKLPVNRLTIVHVDKVLSKGTYYIKIVSSRGNHYETFIKV